MRGGAGRGGRFSVGAAALAAVLALAAGCGSAPDHGLVVGKRFTPAHQDSWLWCHPIGKVTVCQPMPLSVDDEWELQVRNGEDVGWRDVDQVTYQRFAVGDYYAGSSG